MEKPASTDHPIHDLLRRRWSPRAFDPRPVEPEQLLSLLEAARWAPSSSNEQPWHFIIATRDDHETFGRLAGCLRRGNRRWAPRAPVLLLAVARLFFEADNDPNSHAWHDLGLAVGNLLAQATALGLMVHQMAGFYRDQAREAFAIPEGYAPVTVIALGYPGDPRALPDDLQQRERQPRERQPLTAFVYAGRWGRGVCHPGRIRAGDRDRTGLSWRPSRATRRLAATRTPTA